MTKIIQESDHVQFNLFREHNLTKTFKRGEIKALLKKQVGYPSSDQFLMCITKGVNPPIIKVKRGEYTVNPKPVFKGRLQTVFDEYEKVVKGETTRNGKKSIEEAILVLKNAGYKVLKPITQYEEV